MKHQEKFNTLQLQIVYQLQTVVFHIRDPNYNLKNHYEQGILSGKDLDLLTNSFLGNFSEFTEFVVKKFMGRVSVVTDSPTVKI